MDIKLFKFSWLISLFFLCGTLLATPVAGDLKDVQNAIEKVRRSVQKKKAERARVAKKIKQTDQQLRSAEKRLRTIDKEKKKALSDLYNLQSELAILETKINAGKAQVAHMLSTRYKNQHPDTLILLLKNDDPNKKGRQIQYMRYIQQANTQVIDDLKHFEMELAKQQEELNKQIDLIQDLIRKQTALTASLKRKKQLQTRSLRKADRELVQFNKKIKNLKNNEQRLSSLLKNIAKKKAQEKRRKRIIEQKKRYQSNQIIEERISVKKEAATTKNQAALAVKTQTNNHFARQRGHLQWPVAGNIKGRFGTKKSTGGAWNGVFIATEPNIVYAISTGDVAYAAPLRGYGQTVIVDHGDGYLSVYTGLSDIQVSSGQKLAGRTPIGRSGRLPDGQQGIYFEIRYRTKPLNPTAWMR